MVHPSLHRSNRRRTSDCNVDGGGGGGAGAGEGGIDIAEAGGKATGHVSSISAVGLQSTHESCSSAGLTTPLSRSAIVSMNAPCSSTYCTIEGSESPFTISMKSSIAFSSLLKDPSIRRRALAGRGTLELDFVMAPDSSFSLFHVLSTFCSQATMIVT